MEFGGMWCLDNFGFESVSYSLCVYVSCYCVLIGLYVGRSVLVTKDDGRV